MYPLCSFRNPLDGLINLYQAAYLGKILLEGLDVCSRYFRCPCQSRFALSEQVYSHVASQGWIGSQQHLDGVPNHLFR